MTTLVTFQFVYILVVLSIHKFRRVNVTTIVEGTTMLDI